MLFRKCISFSYCIEQMEIKFIEMKGRTLTGIYKNSYLARSQVLHNHSYKYI